MEQNKLSFESENLGVDYISFNLKSFMDPEIIAHRLSKHFTPHVLINDEPKIGFHGLKKNIRFLSFTIRDLKAIGLELRLFYLEKCGLFL